MKSSVKLLYLKNLTFINKIAKIDKEMNHHPEWSNAFRRVEVKLMTHHDVGGITDLDFELAKNINNIA